MGGGVHCLPIHPCRSAPAGGTYADQDGKFDLLIGTEAHNEGQKKCCTIKMAQALWAPSMEEYAFMIEQMIYCSHKCAFSDIADLKGFRAAYIRNELSIKKIT